MTRRILTSGTALTVSLALCVPAMPSAQTRDIPPCENPQGKLWADIIGPGDYEVPPDYEAPAVAVLPGADAGAGQLLPGQGVCVIDLPDVQLHVNGTVDADGGVVVRKPAVIAAAERMGLRIGGRQGHAATPAQQAQEQLDQLVGQLQEQQQALQGADEDPADRQAQQSAEQEVGQQDTLSSTEAANRTVAAQAATGEGSGAEVETETVTEAETRSSAEDFATSVTGKPRQGGGGSDRLQDFALGALGALAVGQLLDSGARVVANSGDRVVVQRDDGEYEVLKDDNTLLRRPGTSVTTERFSDGSSRETMTRRNGARIVTVKAADGQVLRRTRIMPDGREVVLFDDTGRVEPVDLSDLPRARHRAIDLDAASTEDLRAALAAAEAREVGRRFSLQQVRQIRAVRELVPVIELDAITFDTDSAAIRPSEADELRDLGVAMQRMIERDPYEVFLVEGHTDAVGSASYNLALSDRRAESVALALTEYFDVPPENMVVQGYGESNLKVLTPGPERENRRATVRRITPLLYRADAR